MSRKFMIVLILILILILISVFYYLKENESFNNKLNYSICLFGTNGIADEAGNCIKTLENLNLKNRVIFYSLDKQIDDYMKKISVKSIYRHLKDIPDSGTYGNENFFKITFQKLYSIKNILETTNDIVVYTDTDVVFLKSINDDILKFKNSDYDVMFQCDNKDGDYTVQNCSSLCSGFIFLKPTEQVFNCLNKSIDNMKILLDTNNFEKAPSADQSVVNNVFKNDQYINIGILDLKDYPNGSRYFKSRTVNSDAKDIYKEYMPKIIHNNYIKGNKNKIQRFKNNNLWFI
jgi:hypothetical protein